MKKFLLKTILLLFALIVGGVSSTWADTTGTLTLSSSNKFGTSSGSTKNDDQGNTWTCVGSNIQNSYQTTYSGQQFGTGSTNNTFTFTANFSGKIVTGVSITAAAGNSTPTYDISVGGSSKKSGSLSTTSKTYSTGSISGTGNVVITLNQNGGKKAVYLGSIVVTYSASSGETTTTTIDYSGITNTNKYVSTVAGSLSASVVYGSPAAAVPDASVTWSGDNDAVATINSSTGAITLVGAGTVTFTASYAGVANTYQSSSDTYEMTVTDEDPDLVTIWSENFSDYSADDVPDGGSYSYACTDGGGTTKIYAQNNAGGTSPELLVGKTSGTFEATVTLLHSTYGYDGNLTLKFKSNANNINVKTTTDGITVDGEENEGDGLTFSTLETHTVTFKGVTTATENITIVFTAGSSNVRLDDIVLKGKQAELTVVATPSISPASGAVASGREVEITCATDGATIYYTTDGSTPTSSSTAYNPASKPTITAACTINAIGIKAGLTNSAVASASYTIAAPCATPAFSVAAGEVDKGTTVSLSCDTDGATIYYTTNGTTPTTSSSVYSSELTINTAQTIKAIAVKDGYANSEVASATYTVIDYTSLPFNWAGGTSTAIAAVAGVTTSGLGSDYAAGNAPYRIKMDGVGDYIQVKTNAKPGKVYVNVKMLGGSSTSKIKVQESADGTSFTDVEELTISGNANDVLNLVTTNDIKAASRYIKIIKSVHGSNIGVGAITITGCESVTIGSAGYTTYTTTGKVTMPSGVTAYIATAVNTNTIHMEEVENVPASTPIVLKAIAGTYYLPIITTDPDDVSGNILQSSDGNVEGDGETIFALGYKNSTIGFYVVNDDQTVPAGKAYLIVGSGVREFLNFSFDDTETGINSIENGKLTIDNYYDLSGRRVVKPTKGLYIVNGKKVFIKK